MLCSALGWEIGSGFSAAFHRTGLTEQKRKKAIKVLLKKFFNTLKYSVKSTNKLIKTEDEQ